MRLATNFTLSIAESSLFLALLLVMLHLQRVYASSAYIDSPRLDLKQNPMYEDEDLALFKTHYYGGIKNINGQPFLLLYTVS